MRPFLLLALAVSLIPVLPAAEVVWPGLLGPQRDGWAEHFKVPARWPKQLKKEWSADRRLCQLLKSPRGAKGPGEVSVLPNPVKTLQPGVEEEQGYEGNE